MSVTLPIQEEGLFSSNTPSDAELSMDDKRRSPKQSEREHSLLSSEYVTATEMVCSSHKQNGGMEDAQLDNNGDWKNTTGGNPNRFHPIWGPPIPRSGMTMSIGNGVTTEEIEWDPFFGPPVRKSRGIPAITKAIESGASNRMSAGLQDNYRWESLDSGGGDPRLQVPQQYQIGTNPQQPLFHQQQLPPNRQQYMVGMQPPQQPQFSIQQQQQQQRQLMVGTQQWQQSQYPPQQQGYPTYNQPQPTPNQNPQQQIIGGYQQQPNQQGTDGHKYQQQDPFVPPSSGQTLSEQSSLGIELEPVKAGGVSTPGSSSLDVDAISGGRTGRSVQQSPPLQPAVDDDDI